MKVVRSFSVYLSVLTCVVAIVSSGCASSKKNRKATGASAAKSGELFCDTASVTDEHGARTMENTLHAQCDANKPFTLTPDLVKHDAMLYCCTKKGAAASADFSDFVDEKEKEKENKDKNKDMKAIPMGGKLEPDPLKAEILNKAGATPAKPATAAVKADAQNTKIESTSTSPKIEAKKDASPSSLKEELKGQ